MRKYWNVAADGAAEIYIYGELAGETVADTDVTAAAFAADLEAFNGADVVVHVNSGGGDVFAALAIVNTLKAYPGKVTVTVDGLAASAASLILMAGDAVTMAENALIMIHSPAVALEGCFSAEELAKVQTSLDAVTQSILQTYSARLNETTAAQMMAAETWLNAEQALEAGLVDEITEPIHLRVDDSKRLMFVNSLTLSAKNYSLQKIHRAMGKSAVEKIRAAELKRMRALHELKTGEAIHDALIDVAILRGATAEELRPYLDAIKTVKADFAAVIRDQMNSGAAGVKCSRPVDERAAQLERIVSYANKG